MDMFRIQNLKWVSSNQGCWNMFLPVNRGCLLAYQRCARLSNNCDYVKMVESLSKIHVRNIYVCIHICVHMHLYICTYNMQYIHIIYTVYVYIGVWIFRNQLSICPNTFNNELYWSNYLKPPMQYKCLYYFIHLLFMEIIMF